MCSSIRSFYKHTPDPVLGAGDTAVRKTAGPPLPSRSFLLSGGDRHQSSSHTDKCEVTVLESGVKARSVAPEEHRRICSCPSPHLRQQHLIHLTAQPKTLEGLLPPQHAALGTTHFSSPELIGDPTPAHHIPPAPQPRAPSSWMQLTPHWAVGLDFCPVESAFHTAAEGSSQAVRSGHSLALSPAILACLTQTKLKPISRSHLPPTFPASSPDTLLPTLAPGHRPSPSPAHMNACPPQDLCTHPSLHLKGSSPRYHSHSRSTPK